MASLVQRIQNILLKPKAEWEVIDGEPATIQSLFLNYACVLAAIPAIALIIGGLFPICVLGVCYSRSPISVVLGGVVYYVASLAGTYVIGMIINMLAPNFGGQQNQIQAMKVAVYSFTASWLAGIFSIWPPLALLGILGFYSFYLLFVGLPPLMKSPADKSLGYTIVSILLGIVVFLVIGIIASVVEGIGEAVPTVAAPAAIVAPATPVVPMVPATPTTPAAPATPAPAFH
jgi:hypothetical protein